MNDHTLILGAGPCGLALALELGRQAHAALLVDRNPEAGGLARTFGNGPFQTDISIHRLQVQRPPRLHRIDALLAEQFVQVNRKMIHLQLNGRRVPYPMRLGSLARLPWLRSARAGIQILQRRLDPSPDSTDSYRAWFESRYGEDLYRWISGPLLEKQWGIPGDELSSAFAEHRRFSVGFKDFLSGFPLLRGMVHQAVPVDFLYGRRGSGPMMARLARQVIQQGSRILLSRQPTRIKHRLSRVQAVELDDGTVLSCRELASTIPLPALVRLMDPPPPAPLVALADRLRFGDLVVVALALDRPGVSRDHTTYFPERRFPFSRTFECKNASDALVPAGQTVLGFELPCFRDDPLWSLPDHELVQWMASMGKEVGFSARELIRGFVIRVPDAYPLYRVGHQQVTARVLRWLHGELKNLFVVGRNGLMRLDNMDHAFTMGLDLAGHLLKQGTTREWFHGLERYEELSYID